MSVDGAIDVVPAATNASVGLVDAPIRTDRIAVLAGHFTEQRQEASDPAVDRALIDQDATLSQPLADFGVAQSVTDVLPHGQHNDLVSEGAA